MGRIAPTKALTRQTDFIIATRRQVILDYVFTRSIVKRIGKNSETVVSRNAPLRLLHHLPYKFVVPPAVKNRSGDVMRPALPFDSVRCRCTKHRQRSDTG